MEDYNENKEENSHPDCIYDHKNDKISKSRIICNTGSDKNDGDHLNTTSDNNTDDVEVCNHNHNYQMEKPSTIPI